MKNGYAETIETLTRLGLTLNQARVYVSLVRSGPATAKEIAKNANITRQDIYRIMPSLQAQSMVEKIISSPIRYKAVAPKQAVSALLKRRTSELNDLQEKAEHLPIFSDDFQEEPSFEKQFEFTFVPEKEAIIKRIRDAIDGVQETLDIVTLPKRLPQATLEFFDTRMKALKRGVKIRLLSEELSTKAPSVDRVFAIEKKAGVRIRNLSNPPPAGVLIFDRKEVIIITSATATLPEAPALWSNNSCLVGVAQNYFEDLWKVSTQSKD